MNVYAGTLGVPSCIMYFTQPLWAVGEPEELAISFTSRTEEQGRLLGRGSYKWLLAAIASTSVHNALAQATATDGQLEMQVRNVLSTAHAAERLIAATVPPELDEEGDEGEASSSSSTTSSTNDDDDAPTSKSREGIHVSADESPLGFLETALRQVLATLAGACADNAGSALGNPHSWLGSYPLSVTSPALPAPSLPVDPSRSTTFPTLLDCLKDPEVAELLARLDGRSAAAAAATCKRLHNAHELLRFFELPPPVRCYLSALLGVQDDFSDGSVESEFNACFPIDGSPVCGADLAEEAYNRRMVAAMPDMESVFALLSGPGGRSVEEFRTSIARIQLRRLPAPHPQSTPLAFFKQSMPVPYVGCDGPGSSAGPSSAAAVGSTDDDTTQPQAWPLQLPPRPPSQAPQLQNQPLHQLALRSQNPHPHRLPHSVPLLPALWDLREALLPARQQLWQLAERQHPPPLPAMFSEPHPSTPPPTRPTVASLTPLRQLPLLTGVGLGSSTASNAPKGPPMFPPLPSAGPGAAACVLPPAAPVGAATAAPLADGPNIAATGPIAAAAAAAAAGSSSVGTSCCLANAICDVQELWDLPTGQLHLDGDLLAASGVATGGWGGGGDDAAALRRGSPAATAAVTLSAVVLGRGSYPQYDVMTRYNTRSGRQSLPPSPSAAAAAAATPAAAITRLCADGANGLVWAASGEKGGIIRGFRAPVGLGLVTPAAGAGCRRAGACSEENGTSAPRYLLSCDVGGLEGSAAGLHVLGSRLLCVKSSGALLSWHVPSLPSYTAAAGEAAAALYGGAGAGINPRRRSTVAEWGDPMDFDGDAASDEHDGVFFDDDDELVEVRPLRRRRRDDSGAAATSVGEPSDPAAPHDVTLLQLPSTRGSPSAASLLQSFSRDADFNGGSGSGGGGGPIRLTRLLYDASAPAAPTLAAALTGNIIVSYDLETQRAKQLLFGHLYEVTDIAVPPPAWGQSSLFATCARSGDVKLWDVRSRGGSAAVTLTGGETWHLNAVVLAATNGGGGGGGQLGAGMVCFAGGEGESIWAWDLRGGHARPMYELSTGNTQVTSLAWHGAGNSLIASCQSRWPGGRGAVCDPRDWKPLREEKVAGSTGAGGARNGAPAGEGGAGSSAAVSSCCSAGVDASGSSSAGVGASGSSSAGGGSTRTPSDHLSPRSRGSARTMSDGDGGGGGGGDRRLYWPARAKHQPADFPAYFSMARSGVFRYRFSQQASRMVPRSSQPHF